jgi:hypothetical protein
MSVSRISNGSGANESHRQFRIAGIPPSAIAFLILSATIMLLWSHDQLLWGDEFGFGLLGIDSGSSIARLIHIELTTPVSFDPLGYNALIYAVIHFFGSSAFAMRLPSMCGYLLMQICLFYFVRRIANERAATFALAFPALIGLVGYSVQARPYGLLLGLSGLAMLSWQSATRLDSRRAWALVLLSLSLILAVNTQYYAVLLFVPLCAAEFLRTLERRRVDIPVLVSIVAGMAGLVVVMPFAKALSPFRANHSDQQAANYHFITHSYLWMMVGYMSLSVPMQHLIGSSVLLLLFALVAGFIRFHSRVNLRLRHAEVVFLFALLAFPVLGYLLANFVTHFVEARYMQPAIIGISALLAILIAPLVENKTIGRIVLALLFFAIAGTGVLRIRAEREHSREMMASLVLDPATQNNLKMFPEEPIYVSNHSIFEFIHYYSPSADIRSRITLVYENDNGLGLGADISRQIANMRIDGVPHVVPYESMSQHGTEDLFLLYHNPWDWDDPTLAQAHAQITHLGKDFWGDLVSVRFP